MMPRYAHLLALVALVMLVASGPAFAQTDYDSDNDNYIDVSTHAQLNAIRWDLNGDGTVAATDTMNYNAAFPNAATGMGCLATCVGYELTANIDLDTDGDGNIGTGWTPIGTDISPSDRYQGDFKGNGYTVDNLFINRSNANDQGLFGAIHTTSRVESLGVTNANVTGDSYIGILAGTSYGTIVACYTTGSTTGGSGGSTGGLVGYLDDGAAVIESSYSTASVRGPVIIGGLLGYRYNGTIKNSYATGRVTRSTGTETSIDAN